jgi:hypothetical protein
MLRCLQNTGHMVSFPDHNMKSFLKKLTQFELQQESRELAVKQLIYLSIYSFNVYKNTFSSANKMYAIHADPK